MVSTKCFVPGCKTGYACDRKRCKLEGKKVNSIFKPPEDDHLFAKWKRIIPRADRELTRKSRICELHFRDDDIERYYITKISDGTIHKLKKGTVSLKAGAVPCIFPSLDGYFSKGKKKSHAKQKYVIKEEVLSESDTMDMDEVEGTLQDNTETELPSEFEFDSLLEDLDAIQKPSQGWCVSYTGDYVMCAKWNAEYAAEKRVIIKKNLNVKVFIKDSEFTMVNYKTINSANDVSLLLEKIDVIIPCAEIQDITNAPEKKCVLYLPS